MKTAPPLLSSHSMVLLHNDISPSGGHPEQRISNISQILLVNKNMRILQQIWFPEIPGVYYWYIKIPQYGYIEHGLDVTFYVQKLTAPRVICYNPLLVHNKTLEAPAFVRLVYCEDGRLPNHVSGFGYIFFAV